MLQHQDRPQNPAYGGQGGTGGGSSSSSSSLRNRKCDTDSNFNFLPGRDDDGAATTGYRGGDENRNQVRPRNLSPLGRDQPTSLSSPGFHHSPGPLSPLSRLPCWSPLEPLPEIESGDDGYGRVPPDGAEEGKMVDEEETRGMFTMNSNKEKAREMREAGAPGRKGGMEVRGGEEDEEEVGLEDEDEWGDSDSDFEFSYRSGGSLSSLNMESGGEGVLMGGWDRIGVGEPKFNHQGDTGDATALNAVGPEPTRKWDSNNKEPTGRRRSVSRKYLTGTGPGNTVPAEANEERDDEDQSSDSDGELPELMDAVWTLRDRERFKAQEMEKHQVQLTMYRRLALIRWVRTLQGRIQEQQNRLQSSFDVILTHRKELLRMGAAATVATPAAAVSQS
ncbi:uncharacterized protein c19h1orf216 isoform 2-T3 [Polymixia lowei]